MAFFRILKLILVGLLVLIVSLIVIPFRFIWASVVFIRHGLYDIGFFKTYHPEDVFTIGLGNLNFGGTGKSPHVALFTELFQKNKNKVTILSRGFGRLGTGFILADEESDVHSIGDEPMMFKIRFGNKNTNIAVSKDRRKGIIELQKIVPDNEVVILDDSFQHRKVKPHLQIMLTEYSRLFYKSNFFLGTGSFLRDLRSSAKRADIVIVTKCPDNISYAEYKEIRENILTYTKPNTPIYFSGIKYKSIQSVGNKVGFNPKKPVIAVSGIAHNDLFIDFLDENYKLENIHEMNDHHHYTRNDIDKIMHDVEKNEQVVTTEKDIVKIFPLLNEREYKHFFFLPIEVEIENQREVNELILRRFKEFQQSKSK